MGRRKGDLLRWPCQRLSDSEDTWRVRTWMSSPLYYTSNRTCHRICLLYLEPGMITEVLRMARPTWIVWHICAEFSIPQMQRTVSHNRERVMTPSKMAMLFSVAWPCTYSLTASHNLNLVSVVMVTPWQVNGQDCQDKTSESKQS